MPRIVKQKALEARPEKVPVDDEGMTPLNTNMVPELLLQAVLRNKLEAKKILLDGLKYHEHDGHNLPKQVVREALVALGVSLEDQP
jgi:hypothetical protein